MRGKENHKKYLKKEKKKKDNKETDLKGVFVIKSEENAELNPMLIFDKIIRTIFVSSCILV